MVTRPVVNVAVPSLKDPDSRDFLYDRNGSSCETKD